MKKRAAQSELATIVAEMRALGVTEYQRGDVHLVLGPEPPKPPTPDELARRARALTPHARKAWLERMLFASSEGDPDDDDLPTPDPETTRTEGDLDA